ncbi:MAG: MFS transporter [Chloroflexota bacterium]|nr:MFS transporter [Chloroflexota bacterium]
MRRQIRAWFVTDLWHHRAFRRLWGAHTVSALGSHVSTLAIPLLAVLTLDASPADMGVLTAVTRLPSLLFGLGVGVLVDRLRRQPLLIGADLARAALLLLIPIFAVTNRLSVEVLIGVGFAVGTMTLLFDVSATSYLPALVSRHQLVDANAKLQASTSAAQAIGPGFAGALMSATSPFFAIVVDAVSFVASAFILRGIRQPEAGPRVDTATAQRRSWRALVAGFPIITRDPLLRALVAGGTLMHFFGFAFFPAYLIFLARDLGLAPVTIGAIQTIGGIGGLVGALLAGRVARRLGLGPAIILSQIGAGITGAGFVLAVVVPFAAVPLLIVTEMANWIATTIYVVNASSLRQAVTPDQYLGRVNATVRTLMLGAAPLGGLAGGAVAQFTGAGPALVIASIGFLTAMIPLLLSPLPTLRLMPGDSARSEEREI